MLGGYYRDQGTASFNAGRLSEAVSAYSEALRLDPMDLRSMRFRGFCQLALGHYIDGFQAGECRQLPVHLPHSEWFAIPEWTTQDLNGKTILVYCELGLGDMVMMGRYLPWLKLKGATVVVLMRPELVSWFVALGPYVDACIPLGTAPPPVNYKVSMWSLPHRACTTLETIPPPLGPQVPAWLGNKTLQRSGRPHSLAEVLGVSTVTHSGATGLPRIGVVWRAGGALHPNPRMKDVPLRTILTQIPIGVTLVCLQQKVTSAESALLMTHHHTEFPIRSTYDVLDTAKVMAGLDYIVTVDTMVAHVAGSLGVSGSVIVSSPADWRWGSGEAAPWYPTLRVVRTRKI